MKDLEIEWVLAFNEWLKNDFKNYDYPAVEIGDVKDPILEIKKLLKL